MTATRSTLFSNESNRVRNGVNAQSMGKENSDLATQISRT